MQARIRSYIRQHHLALVALFFALTGVGIAASGGNFILGRSNSANRTTSLTGSPGTGPALKVKNTTSGHPAAAFKVLGGAQPFAVNSATKVNNLNADRLDGLSSKAFQEKGDTVRIFASLNVGKSNFWDIGPYIRLTAADSYSSGTNHCTQDLLNTAPGTGYWRLGDLNNGQAFTNAGYIDSGHDGRITEAVNPAPTNSSIFHTATLIWWDDSETITINYYVIAYMNYCVIAGTAARAT